MSYVPYQVDYKVQGAGKTLGVTKKKVSWKFGFASDEALANGFSGSHCRGSEHEVVFVWSLKSGKRQILVDGKEAHFSESGMNGWTSDRTFQHHFNMYSPNYGTIRCHLITLPPNYDAPGGNKPFQLRVNGVNFFDFTQIFQLGTPAMVVRPAPTGMGGGSRDDAYASAEERKAIARAKLESMRDLHKTSSREDEIAPPASTEQSLISFDDPPPRQGVQAPNHMMSSITLDPAMRSTSFDNASYPSNATPAAGVGVAAAPAPYANYALPPAAAPVAAPQYGQQPSPYSQNQSGYNQAPAPYGQAPVAPSPQQSYGFAPQPPAAPAWGVPAARDSMNSTRAVAAPAPTWEQSQTTHFAQPPAQVPLAVNTGVAPGANPAYAGSTPHSQASYGSAPSFAQPPRPPQPGQYGGY